MKSQASVEYLMIFGFVVLITIPLIIGYFSYTSEISQRVTSSQIDTLAKKIVDSAETVYYLGEPSQTTIRAYIPNGVSSVNLSGKEIIYRVITTTGTSDIVRISSVNLTGSLPKSQGNYLITIKAEGGRVNVSYR